MRGVGLETGVPFVREGRSASGREGKLHEQSGGELPYTFIFVFELPQTVFVADLPRCEAPPHSVFVSYGIVSVPVSGPVLVSPFKGVGLAIKAGGTAPPLAQFGFELEHRLTISAPVSFSF